MGRAKARPIPYNGAKIRRECITQMLYSTEIVAAHKSISKDAQSPSG